MHSMQNKSYMQADKQDFWQYCRYRLDVCDAKHRPPALPGQPCIRDWARAAPQKHVSHLKQLCCLVRSMHRSRLEEVRVNVAELNSCRELPQRHWHERAQTGYSTRHSVYEQHGRSGAATGDRALRGPGGFGACAACLLDGHVIIDWPANRLYEWLRAATYPMKTPSVHALNTSAIAPCPSTALHMRMLHDAAPISQNPALRAFQHELFVFSPIIHCFCWWAWKEPRVDACHLLTWLRQTWLRHTGCEHE
jgi:hypothetical protein